MSPDAAATPAHWLAVTERGIDGPVVIFDLDGVMSDASGRQRFLDCDPPDWDSFNEGVAEDPPIADGIDLARSMAETHRLVVLSARPVATRDLTLDWMERQQIPVDLLILRAEGDHRSSPEVKRDELARLCEAGADVRLAIDDHPGIVEMYRSENIEVRYVHSGYYERGEV